MVNAMVCAVIDRADGVRRVQRRVPPRNRTIFTDKDENRGCGSSILCHLEELCVVKHDAGWSCAVSVPRGRGISTTSGTAVPS